MKGAVHKRTTCRACKNTKLTKVLSLGPTPLANAFLTKEMLDKEEMFYPLDVYFCQNCHFLQLGHVVRPEILFKNYVYVSSTSPVFVEHFHDFAHDLIQRFDLDQKSLVVDIGSNDGILLKPLKEHNLRTLGIEPAQNIAARANKDGIKTIAKFFTTALARSIGKAYGQASVVTANNVFAHIDNLDEVIEGTKILLKKNGVFVVEAPYLVDFLTKNYFDLVYHEHLSYLSVKPLQTLFHRFDMEIFDVQKVPVHGGSIRVFVKGKGAAYKQTARLSHFLKLEKRMRLDRVETYFTYADKVRINKTKLIALLTKLKHQGKSIAGYGAPAKGNTLLNYFGIGTDYINYIIDDSPYKQGLYSPGKHIPVVASAMLAKQKPDYLLLLAWNFAKPIMEKLQDYQHQGGKFIVPVPRPKTV
ncbi:MAG: hypothetical protein ACD_36C00018G0001 [uncultured bacterium]|uniref:Methyltransferase n=1 Tax=Candidatus Gottesmanbacteria bacterium RIFCSPLOWO2_01_FULL_43_11b TaxID=1798392 RepID=A0A1F6AIN4_9BACT|nr:MAG: hypothetical protein ACD_36C00018G0001 [uncultured bacterium]OGG24496.1 MAG: hypothetical protein A3A79_04915 [Candidatus Gottesmanbacteria bacterium RIFCSPLOWO2_01_FULL_43_11b]